VIESIGSNETCWGTHFESIDCLRQSLRPLKLTVRKLDERGLRKGRGVMNSLVSSGEKAPGAATSESKASHGHTHGESKPSVSALSDKLEALLVLFCVGNLANVEAVKVASTYLVKRVRMVKAAKGNNSNSNSNTNIVKKEKEQDSSSSQSNEIDMKAYFNESEEKEKIEKKSSSSSSSASSRSKHRARKPPYDFAEILSRLQTDLSRIVDGEDGDGDGVTFLYPALMVLLIDLLETDREKTSSQISSNSPKSSSSLKSKSHNSDKKESASSKTGDKKDKKNSSSPKKSSSTSSSSSSSSSSSPTPLDDDSSTSTTSSADALLRLICRSVCDKKNNNKDEEKIIGERKRLSGGAKSKLTIGRRRTKIAHPPGPPPRVVQVRSSSARGCEDRWRNCLAWPRRHHKLKYNECHHNSQLSRPLRAPAQRNSNSLFARRRRASSRR